MLLGVPLAHAGHWLLSLLYLAPVLIVALVLAWQGRRHDGEPDEGEGEGDGEGEGEPEEAGDEPSLDDIMDGRA